MNLNEFSQAKSEFPHVVQMVRNHIAEEPYYQQIHFISHNSPEKLGEAMGQI